MKADLLSAAAVSLFGLLLLFVIIPVWVPGHEEGGYGLDAQVMPIIWATVTTVLAAGFFVARLLGGRRRSAAEGAALGRANLRFLGPASLFLVAMLALFEWVGFLGAGPLTVAGFMIWMGERRPVAIVLTSVGAAAAIWLFFWQLLKFPLP